MASLASGSSDRWSVAIDESLDGSEWTLELDGPQTYLVAELPGLKTVAELHQFLQSAPDLPTHHEPFALGQFGPFPVLLRWDNEEIPRCFIIIGGDSLASLRITLDESDVRMIAEAMEQVIAELP